MTLKELQAELDARDDGVLLKGTHTAGGTEFCALEFESQVRGRTWSDTPVTLPDVRPLNDGPWSSNQARTNAILPVMVALWEWSTWDRARQQTWIERVVVDTTRQIIGSLPGLPRAIQQQCEAVQDLESAVNTISAAVAAAFATHSVAAYASAAAAPPPPPPPTPPPEHRR